jgi:hypothetical protein
MHGHMNVTMHGHMNVKFSYLYLYIFYVSVQSPMMSHEGRHVRSFESPFYNQWQLCSDGVPILLYLQNTTGYNTLNNAIVLSRFSARIAAFTHVILSEILRGFPQSLQTWHHDRVSVRLPTASYKSFLTYVSPIFPQLTISSMVRNTDSVVKRTLRVFENRVLGKIFGPKRDEVTAGWRRSHNDELLICIPQQILSVLSSQ